MEKPTPTPAQIDEILKKHQEENPFTWECIIDKDNADRLVCERICKEISQLSWQKSCEDVLKTMGEIYHQKVRTSEEYLLMDEIIEAIQKTQPHPEEKVQ